MLGKHNPQSSLHDVGNVFPLELPPASFYGQLVAADERLFNDDDFVALYCATNGRNSTLPSQLALMLVMQTYAGVSDAGAIACATLG